MANTFPGSWPPGQINAEFPRKASTAYSIGDLLYWSSGDNAPLSLSALADQGSEVKQQQALAALFVGVCNSAHRSTDTDTNPLRVLIDGIWEFPSDSVAFAVGDYVGASYNVNVARDQQVDKVARARMAIGRSVKRYASATTRVKCRVMSRYLLGLADLFNGVSVPGGTGKTAMADADTTLTVDSDDILEMTPTANPRKCILPTETLQAGVTKYIPNVAALTNGIQVRNSADNATIITIPAAKTGMDWCDGTNWRGIVSA